LISGYSPDKRNGGKVTSILFFLSISLFILFSSSIKAENNNRVVTGYDSFIDHYTILEDDTTEALQEYYLNLINSFAFGKSKMKSKFGNSLKFGNQTIDERMNLGLEFGHLSSIKTEFKTDLYIKHFRENSDYSFSNDYKQLNTRLKIGREFTDNIKINSKTRFEFIDYKNYTDFNYDYNYIDTGIEINAGSVLSNLFHLTAAYGRCEAPDTTALSYTRKTIELDLFILPNEKYHHDLYLSTDRRNYNGTSRSSLWNLLSFYRLTFSSDSEVEYSLKIDGESTIYDSPSNIYFDTHFLRCGFKLSFPFRQMNNISLEPRYAQMFCNDFEEERYQEYSIITGFELMASDRFWLIFSYEPGIRNYLKGEDGLYSDFYLNRLSLMGSISVYDGISADLFIIHDPERHTRKEDDFSITLISLSLSKQF
jgi:hypothetical protein